MIKKLIYSVVISMLLLQIGYADDSSNHSLKTIPCARELQGCLNKIEQLQEARELIATVQKEGPIRITVNNDPNLTRKFGAFWNPGGRIITVNYSRNISEGSLIGSIIFELHNAKVSSKMAQLDNLAAAGKITRDRYVEEFERLEFINSKEASSLTQKGIQRGIFPPTAYLPTYSTFDEHFFVQKEAGHSAFIANNYDHLAPRKTNTRNQAARYSANRNSRRQFKSSLRQGS